MNPPTDYQKIERNYRSLEQIGITTPSHGHWYQQAACAGMDTKLFYSPEHVPEAIAICNTCPVITECLNWALTAPEPYGVWGGLSESRRRKTPRRRGDLRCVNCGTRITEQRRITYCSDRCANTTKNRQKRQYRAVTTNLLRQVGRNRVTTDEVRALFHANRSDQTRAPRTPAHPHNMGITPGERQCRTQT